MDIYTNLTSMSAAFYFLACLLCGLHLLWNIFGVRLHANKTLSQLMGTTMLVWAGTGACYILYSLIGHECLLLIPYIIDILMFAALGCVAYVLYADRLPERHAVLLMLTPYLLLVVAALCWQVLYPFVYPIAMLILIGQYLYFYRALHRREQTLEQIYSDPESHSLRWLWIALVLFIGWLILHLLFKFSLHAQWTDAVGYLYMTVLILFCTTQICNYGPSVSLETQQQIENENESNLQPADDHLVARLKKLMEKEQVYLNSDLTVEEVASKLNITPWALSAVLNKEMGTSFCQYVNSYRVDHAKQLLKNTHDTAAQIAYQCGFNSPEVFHRTFVKITNQTPKEWRNN